MALSVDGAVAGTRLAILGYPQDAVLGIRLPERLGVVATFQRDRQRLRFELWTTPVGDQIRSILDGTEIYARIVRTDSSDTMEADLVSLRQHALARGWVEDPLPLA